MFLVKNSYSEVVVSFYWGVVLGEEEMGVSNRFRGYGRKYSVGYGCVLFIKRVSSYIV